MNHFEVNTNQLDSAFRQWIDLQPFPDLAAATTRLHPPTAPDATAEALGALIARLTGRLQQLSVAAEDLGARSVLAGETYEDSEQRIAAWMDR